MLRLVKEDWAARLQARLREEVSTIGADDMEILLEPQPRPEPRAESGLTFGTYGHSPISGLHFDTPDDTAAS